MSHSRECPCPGVGARPQASEATQESVLVAVLPWVDDGVISCRNPIYVILPVVCQSQSGLATALTVLRWHCHVNYRCFNFLIDQGGVSCLITDDYLFSRIIKISIAVFIYCLLIYKLLQCNVRRQLAFSDCSKMLCNSSNEHSIRNTTRFIVQSDNL